MIRKNIFYFIVGTIFCSTIIASDNGRVKTSSDFVKNVVVPGSQTDRKESLSVVNNKSSRPLIGKNNEATNDTAKTMQGSSNWESEKKNFEEQIKNKTNKLKLVAKEKKKLEEQVTSLEAEARDQKDLINELKISKAGIESKKIELSQQLMNAKITLTNEKSALLKKIEDSKLQLENVQKDVQLKVSQLTEEHTQDLVSLRDEFNRTQELKFMQLMTENEQKNNALKQKLENTQQQLEGQLSEKTTQHDLLKLAHAELQNEQNKIQAEIASRDQKLEQTEMERERLAATFAQKTQELEGIYQQEEQALENTITGLNGKVEKIIREKTEEIANLKTDYHKSISELGLVNQRDKDTFKQEMEARLKKEAKSFEEKMFKKDQQCISLQTKYEQLTNEIQEVQNQVRLKEDELVQEKNTSSVSSAKYKRQETKLRETITVREEKLKKLEADNQNIKAKDLEKEQAIKVLRDELKKTEGLLNSFRYGQSLEQGQAARRHNDSTQKIEELNARIENLKKELTQVQNDKTRLHNEAVHARQRSENTEQEIKDLKSLLGISRGETSKLTKEVAELSKTSRQASNNLIGAEVERVKTQQNEMIEDFRTLQVNLEKATSEQEKLRQANNGLVSENASLKDQLKASSNEKLVQENNELVRENVSLKEKLAQGPVDLDEAIKKLTPEEKAALLLKLKRVQEGIEELKKGHRFTRPIFLLSAALLVMLAGGLLYWLNSKNFSKINEF
jgi:myosin protein heavy chain